MSAQIFPIFKMKRKFSILCFDSDKHDSFLHEPAGGSSAARLTCLKMSSKLGLLLGSSFQHSFIRVRHSVGASSIDTIGLQRGGGCFRRSRISERQTDRQVVRQTDRGYAERQRLKRQMSCLTVGWHVHHGVRQRS